MGQREVEYLFGSKVGNLARYLYVIAVLIGVYLPLDHIVSLLDLSMAFFSCFKYVRIDHYGKRCCQRNWYFLQSS